MSLTTKQKEKEIKKHQKHGKDTGSTPVQLALVEERIAELSKHIQQHPQDKDSRRGLQKLVAQRRKLLKYQQKNEKKS